MDDLNLYECCTDILPELNKNFKKLTVVHSFSTFFKSGSEIELQFFHVSICVSLEFPAILRAG